MRIIKESNNVKSDFKVIKDTIAWWNYKYTVDESEKSVAFVFDSTKEANNVYKDLKRKTTFKDTWRLDIQDNVMSYDFR